MTTTFEQLLREANTARLNAQHGLADYFTEEAAKCPVIPLKAKETPLNPPSVGKKTHK